MITKIKIQITIVTDCNESGMCKKKLSMQIHVYGFELFKYSLFVIFNNVYYSVFLTNNLYQ